MNAQVNQMMPEAQIETKSFVVLFLVVPGMNNVAVGCAMLIGRLVQETIQRALASQELLLPEPASSWEIVAAMQKETAFAGRGMSASNGMDAPNRFTRDVARRLYGEPSLSFVSHEDQFYFAFPVADMAAGISAVEAETKRLGFLELAEIGHYDSAQDFCRTHFPANAALPLTRHCVDVLKGAGLLPQ